MDGLESIRPDNKAAATLLLLIAAFGNVGLPGFLIFQEELEI